MLKCNEYHHKIFPILKIVQFIAVSSSRIFFCSTVKRRLSKRQLSETLINQPKNRPHACTLLPLLLPRQLFGMLDGYKASEWLKNQRKKNRTVIFTEKMLRFVNVEDVELPQLLFQRILSRQIRYHE